MSPSTPRRDSGLEAQRLDALNLVSSRAEHIEAMAARYGVPSEAIAGAILWDALENPYRRYFLRLGPGKVHPLEFGRKSVAEEAEQSGLIPSPPAGLLQRVRRLREPDWAITYVAAILKHHARNYAALAGVDIGEDAGVLCTLYQGGDSETRARRLARRRKGDPGARPVAANEMGLWVNRHLDFIRGTLDSCERPDM